MAIIAIRNGQKMTASPKKHYASLASIASFLQGYISSGPLASTVVVLVVTYCNFNPSFELRAAGNWLGSSGPLPVPNLIPFSILAQPAKLVSPN